MENASIIGFYPLFLLHSLWRNFGYEMFIDESYPMHLFPFTQRGLFFNQAFFFFENIELIRPLTYFWIIVVTLKSLKQNRYLNGIYLWFCRYTCKCWCSYYCLFDFVSVPNVSFHVYAPGFLARFMESHAVMFQGNAGLKPKEGEVTSRPWQWPINYRVSTQLCIQFT